jgi:hypothetical protein
MIQRHCAVLVFALCFFRRDIRGVPVDDRLTRTSADPPKVRHMRDSLSCWKTAKSAPEGAPIRYGATRNESSHAEAVPVLGRLFFSLMFATFLAFTDSCRSAAHGAETVGIAALFET